MRKDRNGPLGDDRTVVVLLVHEVDRRPAHPCAARDHRLVHAESVHPRTPKGRKQGGVDIDDAPAKAAGDLGGNEAQVSGEHHQVDGVAREEREHPRAAFVAIHRHGRHAVRTPALEGAGIGAVAGHEHHVRGAIGAEGCEVLDDRLEVRPASGGEHGDLLPHDAGL